MERGDVSDCPELEYRWRGQTHYLAIHDIRLKDGECQIGEGKKVRLLDLRGRLTYAPQGADVHGWSRPAGHNNTYCALFFDPEVVFEEIGRAARASLDQPKLYFRDAQLAATLGKLNALMAAPDPIEKMHVETLGILAMLELEHLLSARAPSPPISGRFSSKQERLLRDYVASNLSEDISLSTLAGLVGLSRFHFARVFAQSMGATPLQYLRQRRVEAAKRLLRTTDGAIADIASSVGFASARKFSTTFQQLVGVTPRAFRRSLL